MKATDKQVGGDHYRKLKIQPSKYNHANNIPFIEGCIIKYATRWRDKGGIEDLEKIKHYVDLLIEFESNPEDTKSIDGSYDAVKGYTKAQLEDWTEMK